MISTRADRIRFNMGQVPSFDAGYLLRVVTSAGAILRTCAHWRDTQPCLHALGFASRLECEVEMQAAEKLLNDLELASIWGNLLGALGDERLIREYAIARHNGEIAGYPAYPQALTVVIYFEREIIRRKLTREAGIEFFNVMD